MVLIDRKVTEEQLLLETFFPKMRTEQDIRKKTNNFFPFHIYYNVIDNSLLAQSYCCQISYFIARIVGGYGTPSTQSPLLLYSVTSLTGSPPPVPDNTSSHHSYLVPGILRSRDVNSMLICQSYFFHELTFLIYPLFRFYS